MSTVALFWLPAGLPAPCLAPPLAVMFDFRLIFLDLLQAVITIFPKALWSWSLAYVAGYQQRYLEL
jgi:hypothetical protein